VPPLPSPRFEETMRLLDVLAQRSRDRRASNLRRLSMMVAELDRPLLSEPSAQLGTTPASPSTPPPTPTRSEADDDDLRSQLPERTTRGGPYGDSILERVARSYGL
jgi:hypothetical protein